MGHSKEYEKMRRKLGVHKKEDKPGALLSRMHSLKGMPKKHKLPKTFGGKSTKPGMGGRAKILESKGVPGGVIGNIARSKNEAPGQSGFHKKHKTGEVDFKKHKMACKVHHKVNCSVC